MKKCPYCAEEIQDEAIKCRYCFSDLTVTKQEALTQRPEPVSAKPADAKPADAKPADAKPADAEPADAEPDAQPAPTTPSEPTAAAEPEAPGSGPSDATVRYSHSGYRYVLGYGPDHFGIWDRQSPTEPTERFPRTDEGWRSAWLRFVALEPKHVEVPQEAPSVVAAGATPQDAGPVTYTHSGTRYLLGYGPDFFGIWDRQSPGTPVERFSRTDDGWAQAWRRYTQIEDNFTEVAAG